jgi:DNA polymerase I-like protein with 3'-5' exonuclease and polymerase domains
VVPSEHYVLAGYLQNGESILMKTANLLWRRWADEDGLHYKQVNFVHDEWQTEFYNKDEGDRLGVLQCDAIKKAGIDLGVRCALAGEYRIGRNWRETH